MDMIEVALRIAAAAHREQKDKDGQDYILHPLTVAAWVATDSQKTVALLHDVVHDTAVTLDDLRVAGFSPEIVTAVDCVTERDGELPSVYMTRVKSNELARVVKIADLRYNSDMSRFSYCTDEDLRSIERYRAQLEYLTEQ